MKEQRKRIVLQPARRRPEHAVKEQRKHYTPQEKVAILRRHLVEKQPVSDLCDTLQLRPTVLYRWLKEFFENGAAAFERNSGSGERGDAQQRRITEVLRTIEAFQSGDLCGADWHKGDGFVA